MSCINDEGQILLSFSLGVLLAPFLSTILWFVVFMIFLEVLYLALKGTWCFKIRLGLIVAYIIGTLICAYALEIKVPFL